MTTEDSTSAPDRVKIRNTKTRTGNVVAWDTGEDAVTILFLHGNSSCKEVFIEQFNDPLLSSYRLLAIDLPGHGASDNAPHPKRDYTIPSISQVISDLLEKNNIHSPVVVGWSLGGHIAIEMAGQGLAMRGLVLSGTPPTGPGAEAMENVFTPSPHMALTGKAEFSAEDVEIYVQHTVGQFRSVPDYLIDGVRRTDGLARQSILSHWIEGTEGHNQIEVLRTWQKPIAVIQGEKEPFFNNNYFERLRWNHLWENEVHIIPDAGHAPFRENPALYNKLLLRFIQSTVN